ncbi:VWA domain-containing protein [Streptomyces sp. F001]|uniref:VWA domain-containing protein n=1 Tax=Streptomyces sp. F001 TaxID=1510026 RepID=UPI001F111D92|nr:VWA domain-containing protein [Streptomyces sp. F001]
MISTRELFPRDPDQAVAAAVPDLRGGTRLGELPREFLDRWGQRGMACGAVVVLLPDGWERDRSCSGRPDAVPAPAGAPGDLGRSAQDAPRSALLAAGMAAALPSVDAFAEGPGAGAAGGGGARPR